ncbi:MAG: methyltransferase domain-containing protein [Candidatus Marinimicrobia bacterium]|nr:methyltransferase domain-containing protein [Candidatus Neomarinimicrobiota bacterium]
MYEEYPELGRRLAALKLGHYLEFGCGDGTFLKYILNQNKSFQSIAAVDINPGSVALARNKLDDYAIDFIIQETLPLAFDKHHFSAITLSNTLHHIRDKAAVLNELKRLLKPGGQIIVTEMISNELSEAELTYFKLHCLRADIDRNNQIYHDATYASHEIEGMIKETGLRILSKAIILNEKIGGVDETEIQSVTASLEEMIANESLSPGFEELKQKAQSVKDSLLQFGIKRPRQIYLEVAL